MTVWPTLFYNVASGHWNLWAFVYAQLSYGPTTAFQFEVCFEVSFPFFKIFCCSFAHVLGMIVLLQTISIQLLTMWTDSLEFYSWLLWYTEELMLNSVISRCPVAAQQAWNRHPSTFVLTVGTRCLCWYAVLGFCQMCHCALWPNISTFVSYVQRTFFQKTCFARKYLCKLCCHVPFRRTAFFRPLL